MLELRAPAKINLFLRVLGREPSGFHELETLFTALEFGDLLSLEKVPSGIDLEAEGPAMGPREENLAYRAANSFLRAAGDPGGVRIHLKKRIPVAAGLGGGSSDAGLVLRGLNELFPGALDQGRLLDLARTLGSDVPFFLSPFPLALGRGRGDRLDPLPPLPSAPVLLAFPPVQVSTAEAYRSLAENREGDTAPRTRRDLSPTALSSWGKVASLAENDFEPVVFREHPHLGEVGEALRETGPLLSLLSGSGAALFAVFAEESRALEAMEEVDEAFPGIRFVLTKTLSRWGGPSD